MVGNSHPTRGKLLTIRTSTIALAVILAVGSSVAVAAPGPETFGKKPTTPLELWDAADYLVRTGQAKQALPYLNQFLQGKPDDATLIEGARPLRREVDFAASGRPIDPRWRSRS